MRRKVKCKSINPGLLGGVFRTFSQAGRKHEAMYAPVSRQKKERKSFFARQPPIMSDENVSKNSKEEKSFFFKRHKQKNTHSNFRIQKSPQNIRRRKRRLPKLNTKISRILDQTEKEIDSLDLHHSPGNLKRNFHGKEIVDFLSKRRRTRSYDSHNHKMSSFLNPIQLKKENNVKFDDKKKFAISSKKRTKFISSPYKRKRSKTMVKKMKIRELYEGFDVPSWKNEIVNNGIESYIDYKLGFKKKNTRYDQLVKKLRGIELKKRSRSHGTSIV